jgi:hypothetical protein
MNILVNCNKNLRIKGVSGGGLRTLGPFSYNLYAASYLDNPNDASGCYKSIFVLRA